jgi:hypothetical protein
MSLQEEIKYFCSERNIKYEIRDGNAIIDLSQKMKISFFAFFFDLKIRNSDTKLRIYPVRIGIVLTFGLCMGLMVRNLLMKNIKK